VGARRLGSRTVATPAALPQSPLPIPRAAYASAHLARPRDHAGIPARACPAAPAHSRLTGSSLDARISALFSAHLTALTRLLKSQVSAHHLRTRLAELQNLYMPELMAQVGPGLGDWQVPGTLECACSGVVRFPRRQAGGTGATALRTCRPPAWRQLRTATPLLHAFKLTWPPATARRPAAAGPLTPPSPGCHGIYACSTALQLH
jgi:hypothetical protein